MTAKADELNGEPGLDAAAVIGEEPAATRAAHRAAGHAYRPEVDGLRAVAVVPVILFHAGFGAFGGGYVGVDVFFVISGYLITSIILRERAAGRFSIAAFYERRARRILPALFLVMAACIPLAWYWMLPGELVGFGHSLAAVSTFVSNILFWRTSGYFDGAAELKPLLHTWSLGIEEQYYVLFPLFLAILWRFGMRWTIAAVAAVAAVSLLLSVWMTGVQPLANFFLLPTRAWELLAGSLLAAGSVAHLRWRPPVWLIRIAELIGLLLIAAPIFLYDAATPFPGLAALPPVLGTVLLLACTTPETPVGRLLCLKPVLLIGAISYSAYLWHQPLFAYARLSGAEHNAPLYLGLAALALVLAYFSWRFVEAPFRDRKRFTRNQIFLMSALGSAAFIAAGAGLAWSNGAPQRFTPEVRRLINVDPQAEGCPISDGVGICRIGAPGREPSVVMLGDSHAYALRQALGEELAGSGRAGLLVHTDCHPIPGLYDSREPPTPARVARCEAANRRMLALATAPSVEGVIVAVRWTLRLYPMGGTIDAPGFDNGEGGVEHDSPWRRNVAVGADGRETHAATPVGEAVRRYLATLAAARPTVAIYPVPEVGWNPARQILNARDASGAPPAAIGTSWPRYRQRNAAAEALLDAVPGLFRVRPEQLLCGRIIANRCAVLANGTMFYRDDDHLSDAAAGPVVRAALRRLGLESDRPPYPADRVGE